MDIHIVTKNLYEFLLENNHSHYAEIMWECGCVEFIDKQLNDDYTGYDYTFRGGFVDGLSKKFNILYIESKSYIIYEVEEKKIVTWVCYTEEQYKRKSYMLQLLKKLSDKYTKHDIPIDTYNEGLMQLCNKIDRDNISLRIK